MPDRVIRLTLPPDTDLSAVASVAVRAAARQVALADTALEQLRAEVEAAFVVQAGQTDQAIELSFHPSEGRLVVEVGPTTLESGS